VSALGADQAGDQRIELSRRASLFGDLSKLARMPYSLSSLIASRIQRSISDLLMRRSGTSPRFDLRRARLVMLGRRAPPRASRQVNSPLTDRIGDRLMERHESGGDERTQLYGMRAASTRIAGKGLPGAMNSIPLIASLIAPSALTGKLARSAIASLRQVPVLKDIDKFVFADTRR